MTLTDDKRVAVPAFADSKDVYDVIGKLFLDLQGDVDAVGEFRKANTIVQYVMHDPEAVITVEMAEGRTGKIHLGETDMVPEVVMEMDADIAHRFWLGKVNVTVALARGQMTASGPVEKILRLVPMVKPLFERYRAQLEAQGRRELLA